MPLKLGHAQHTKEQKQQIRYKLHKILSFLKSRGKQILDLSVFAIGVVLVIKYGDTITEGVMKQMPTEANLRKAIQEMKDQGVPIAI